MNQEKPDHIQEKLYSARAGGPIVLGLSLALLLDLVLFVFSPWRRGVADIARLHLARPGHPIPAVGQLRGQPERGPGIAVLRTLRRHSQRSGTPLANPLYKKERISLRARNFETERSKVNDTDGNPIEMAAVVVWNVVDTAEATFEVDDYINYVHVQSESAGPRIWRPSTRMTRTRRDRYRCEATPRRSPAS